MDILTLNHSPLHVEDVIQEDILAYEHPLKHYVSTYDGSEIILKRMIYIWLATQHRHL